MKETKSSVATFSDLEKAEHVKDYLAKAGVEAEVVDESKLQRLWFVSKPLAGEKVVVRQEDFDRAMEVLKVAEEKEHILSGEVRCPECGSAEIEYPQFTRKFVTTTLVEVACLLRVVDKQFYCVDCQHTWSADTKLRKSDDLLNWPKRDSAKLVKRESAVQ